MTSKGILVLLVVGTLFLSVLGFANPMSSTTSVFSGSSTETYYMVTFLSGINFWRACYYGFEVAGKQLGVNTVYTGYPTADISGEVNTFNAVAAKNPAGIAVTAFNPDAFVAPINAAMKSGIPVVTFDSDAPNSMRLSYVGQSNSYQGSQAAQFLASLLGGKGKIALLYTIGQGNIEERVGGFLSTIKNYPSIKVIQVNDGGDQLTATKNMSAAIVSNPDLNAIFCVDGVAGVGGIEAVKETGNVGKIKLLTYDVDPSVIAAVHDGMVSATIIQGMAAEGYWSMMFLYAAYHHLTPSNLPPSVNCGINFGTAQNINELLNEEGLTPTGLPK